MAWMLYMLQRRIKMNFGTLLGLISGGKYQTSDDLPTIPEMAHSYIDQIKDTHDQQQQREMQIQGQGLGLLDMMTGPAKAASLISVGTPKFMKIMKDLELSQKFSPKLQRGMIDFWKKRRAAGGSAKYKDAPRRELEDMILKLDDLQSSNPIAQASKEKIKDSRYLLDKKLYEGMSNLEEAGGMSAGNEINIKNAFNTLMDFIK